MSGENLSRAEIAARYPNEWVFVDRATLPKRSEPFAGRVVWHHRNRDEFDSRLEEFQAVTRGAIWYTGEPDPNEIWLLNL